MKEQIKELLEQAQQAFDTLDEALHDIPWGEKDQAVSLWRDKKGNPRIGVSILDDGCNVAEHLSSSFDAFFDWTEEVYECEDFGALVTDLELLKSKIQERINKARAQDAAQIEEESN